MRNFLTLPRSYAAGNGLNQSGGGGAMVTRWWRGGGVMVAHWWCGGSAAAADMYSVCDGATYCTAYCTGTLIRS